MSEQRTPEDRDIVERLRSRAWEDRHHRKYREDAASEITSLRDRLRELEAKQSWHCYCGQWNHHFDTNCGDCCADKPAAGSAS